MPRRIAVPLLLASLTALPAAAQDLGFRGWGMHLGSTGSPSMIVIGADVDLGRLTERLWIVPAVDLASGSDTTVLSVSLPVQFHLTDEGELRPYAGAGVIATALDLEDARPDQDGVEVGALVVAGFGLQRTKSTLFVEANLSTGDAYTSKIVIGWRF